MSVIDADGHVTETQEQLARYLEEPYRRRPHGFPWVPQDGWNRRAVRELGHADTQKRKILGDNARRLYTF